MRVCFLLHELGRAGGMGVIARHVELLNARPGWEAEIVLVDDIDDREWDYALATWWETADALWRVRAKRRGVFLQSFEERFYSDRELWERLGAASVLALPVDYVTVGSWMRDVLAELRPDARCVVVRNGIEKDVFTGTDGTPQARPLRVLIEGNPDMWLKAVPDAEAAVQAMTEPAEVTLVSGGRSAQEMADLYSSHHVLLKLSRVEGVALPPIEAMHCGTPCVVTPHSGYDEYVEHGVNGLVVGFDDRTATTDTLDRLARDRGLLARLSDGAVRTAAAWPSAEESSAQMAEALTELAAAPPPPVEPAMRALHERQRLAIELGRGQLGELTWYEREHERVSTELEDIKGERAYRMASAVRRKLR
jgi:glycosyltransferase involved in cell wall biosynthesis